MTCGSRPSWPSKEAERTCAIPPPGGRRTYSRAGMLQLHAQLGACSPREGLAAQYPGYQIILSREGLAGRRPRREGGEGGARHRRHGRQVVAGEAGEQLDEGRDAPGELTRLQ